MAASQTMRSKRQTRSARSSRGIDSPTTAGPLAKGYDIEGLYIISVACRLLEMHPQTLRKYERMGLVKPSRTVGMVRLYSQEDIAKLRVVKYLVDEVGLNLAGVELALGMMERLEQMYKRISSLDEHQTVRESVIMELQHILAMFETEVPE